MTESTDEMAHLPVLDSLALNGSGFYRKKQDQKDPRCFYCQRKSRRFAHFTLDHLIPISKGGSDSADNIVLCCSYCNQDKAALTPVEFAMLNIRRAVNSYMRICLEDGSWSRFSALKFITFFTKSIVKVCRERNKPYLRSH